MSTKFSTLILLILAAIVTLSCVGEIGINELYTPTETPTSTTIPTATSTNTAIPPTLTNTATFTALPPTETNTPVFVPNLIPVRKIFIAEDGRQLVGYYHSAWKPDAPVVVLMHQFEGNQVMWQQSPIITWLQNWPVPFGSASPTPSAEGKLPIMPADLSFAVFTFDFRGHGESLPADTIQDGFRAHADELLMDARAAYQTARLMPGVEPNKVIGIGASIGADAVVDTCGEGCVGAFSISPGNWLGVDYGKATQALIAAEKPVRCVYSVNDVPTPATCWSLAPNELYKILAYPGKKHGMTFVSVPRKMDEDFGAILLDFLQATILE